MNEKKEKYRITYILKNETVIGMYYVNRKNPIDALEQCYANWPEADVILVEKM